MKTCFVLTLILALNFIGCGDNPLEIQNIELGMEKGDNLIFQMPIPDWVQQKVMAAPSDGGGEIKPILEPWIRIYVLIASGGQDNQYLYLSIDGDQATGSTRVPVGTAILQAFYEENHQVIYKSSKKTLEVEEKIHYLLTMKMKKVSQNGKISITVTWSDEEEEPAETKNVEL